MAGEEDVAAGAALVARLRSSEWASTRYREGWLFDAAGDQFGSVVRVTRRIHRRVKTARDYDFGILERLKRCIVEIRDLDDRCVQRIVGPCFPEDTTVRVTTAQGEPVVAIEARRRRAQPRRWSPFEDNHRIVVDGDVIGRIDSGLERIYDANDEQVLWLRRVNVGIVGERYCFGIEEAETPKSPFLSIAVVASVCRRFAQSGSSAPGGV